MKSFIRLASTHVKTRRLYYFFKMTKIIDQYGPINPDLLENRLISFSNLNHNAFQDYKDPTGKIETKTGFQRYLNVAMDMGIITMIEKKLLNTVDGSVLSKLNFENEGPYCLSHSLKTYFFKKILEKDFDYMMIIFLLHKLNNITSSDFIQAINSYFLIRPITQEKQDALSKIMSWKSPERYFRENIYAPRRSWLIDLGLITPLRIRGRSRIHFKGNIQDLLINIFSKTDVEILTYFKNDFFKDVSMSLLHKDNLELFSNYTFEYRNQIVKEFLDKAFQIFRSQKRISSKIFLEYFPIYSLCNNKFIIEQNELEDELLLISSQEDAYYRYRPVTEMSPKTGIIDAGYITRQ